MPVIPRKVVLGPSTVARRNAILKGVLQGDRKWLYIGGTFWAAHFARRFFGKRPEIVTIEKMMPGQWMSLRTITPPTRKERKAVKRAARAS